MLGQQLIHRHEHEAERELGIGRGKKGEKGRERERGREKKRQGEKEGHISSIKPTLPSLSQIVFANWDKTFKYISLRGPFLTQINTPLLHVGLTALLSSRLNFSISKHLFKHLCRGVDSSD